MNPFEKIKQIKQEKERIQKAAKKHKEYTAMKEAMKQSNLKKFGFDDVLRDREFVGEDINLYEMRSLCNCKFINCNIKYLHDEFPLTSSGSMFENVFENCNIEVIGEPFRLIDFSLHDNNNFINTRIDFKEVTRSQLVRFCQWKILDSYDFDGLGRFIKEKFGSCTFDGKTADEFASDLDSGMYNVENVNDVDMHAPVIKYSDDQQKTKVR